MHRIPSKLGFTLPEAALMLGLMVLLSGIGVSAGVYVQQIRRESLIRSSLETVSVAQRFYLIDHPGDSYRSLQVERLIPYFPGGTLPPFPPGAVLSCTNYPPSVSWAGRFFEAGEY